ncbi:hypothetical protein [Streptomyces sp. NPDC001889]
MDHEIQLISDGDGLAVIGSAADVDRFLVSEGLPSKDLGPRRFTSGVGAGAAIAEAGSEMAAESARWVKLTPDSARLVKKYGLRESAGTGLGTGVVKGPKGQVRGFVEFVRGSRALPADPAMLAGAARIMAQVAMQQAMDEITDYLATIDEKVDDVLRAQKDSVVARVVGVGFVIEEAMTIREKRGGRVDEVTWSKVQAAPAAVAETQAYALRRLDATAEKLERKTRIGDLAAAAGDAESAVREWLAVLARCFQLQDAIAVLELDRVRDASPEELNGHRLGLRAARQDRLDHIARITGHLVARMDAAAGTANAKVLLHPAKSPAVVRSSNHVAAGVQEFRGRLGIESGHRSPEARRWVEAATEARDRALETGAKGVGAARNLGSETLDRAGSVKDRLAGGIAERARRRRGNAQGRGGEA